MVRKLIVFSEEPMPACAPANTAPSRRPPEIPAAAEPARDPSSPPKAAATDVPVLLPAQRTPPNPPLLLPETLSPGPGIPVPVLQILHELAPRRPRLSLPALQAAASSRAVPESPRSGPQQTESPAATPIPPSEKEQHAAGSGGVTQTNAQTLHIHVHNTPHMALAGRLTGTVLAGETDVPIPNCQVEIFFGGIREHPISVRRTDASGTFSLDDVCVGYYCLRILTPDGLVAEVYNLRVQPGEPARCPIRIPLTQHAAAKP